MGVLMGDNGSNWQMMRHDYQGHLVYREHWSKTDVAALYNTGRVDFKYEVSGSKLTGTHFKAIQSLAPMGLYAHVLLGNVPQSTSMTLHVTRLLAPKVH